MIESRIYNCIKAEPTIANLVTTWNGEPAVFNQTAPTDTDAGWDTENQYGRVVFALDTSDDPERKLGGNLTIDAIVLDGEEPEPLAEAVKQAIDGCFFTDEEMTVAASWQSTQYFEDPTEKVIGATLIFRVNAFPTQETIYPDFIKLLNEWTAGALQDILNNTIGIESVRVIGQSDLPDAWRPTDKNPAVYWRVTNIGPAGWIPDTYQTSWETATCIASVWAENGRVEREISRVIAIQATQIKRLIFDDMSPLMIDRAVSVNFTADQTQGQITLEATYGVLLPEVNTPPLDHIIVEPQFEEPTAEKEPVTILGHFQIK